MTAQAEVPDPSSFAGTKPALRQHLEGVCHTMSYLMDPNDNEAPAKLGLSAQTCSNISGNHEATLSGHLIPPF